MKFYHNFWIWYHETLGASVFYRMNGCPARQYGRLRARLDHHNARLRYHTKILTEIEYKAL
jgi:hypothetical protein